MSGHVPSASLFDLAGFPLARALVVPVPLAAASLLRSGDDLCLIDPDGQSFTAYGYFSQEPAPLQGADGTLVSAESVLLRTATPSVATFQPQRPFDPDQLETLLTVAFGECTALRWHGDAMAGDRPLALEKTACAGVVTCNGIVLRRGDTVTLTDLQTGQVRYYHDESEAAEDTLEFASTDTADPLVFRVRLSINAAA